MKSLFELIDRSMFSCFTWTVILVLSILLLMIIYDKRKDMKRKKECKKKRKYSLKIYMNM